MAQYLITQSLLSSWLYSFNCAEGYEEEAHDEFLNALQRIRKEPNEAIQNGIDFENLCYQIAAGKFVPEWSTDGSVNRSSYGDSEVMGYNRFPKNYVGAKKVADIIRGAPVQVKASRLLNCSGMSFLIYGILDALKAGTIYDVKFLNKSMGGVELAGKYLESPQHPAYFYIVPEAMEFQYLVSDGCDLYIETYERSQTPHISEYIEAFIADLQRSGLLELYQAHWTAR